MKNLILTVVMSLFLISAYSQEVDSTITIIKKKQYYQNDQKLTGAQLSTILSNNPSSSSEYKKSTKKTFIGLGFMLVGTSIVAVASLIDLSSTIKQTNDLNNGIYTGDYKDVGLGVYLGGLACVIAAVNNFVSNRFFLEPCYPNPARNQVTFRFRINSRTRVKLKITDISGRVQTTVLNEIRKAGDHRLSISVSHLPAGQYIYSINAGLLKASNKLTIIK